jgi:hypothetical protein
VSLLSWLTQREGDSCKRCPTRRLGLHVVVLSQSQRTAPFNALRARETLTVPVPVVAVLLEVPVRLPVVRDRSAHPSQFMQLNVKKGTVFPACPICAEEREPESESAHCAGRREDVNGFAPIRAHLPARQVAQYHFGWTEG